MHSKIDQKISRTLFDEAPQFLDASGVSRESIETHCVQTVGLNVLHELDQELRHQHLLPLAVLGQVGSKYWVCGGGREEGGDDSDIGIEKQSAVGSLGNHCVVARCCWSIIAHHIDDTLYLSIIAVLYPQA